MILGEQRVDQCVDRGERGTFAKQILLTESRVPLALVRKRDTRRLRSGRAAVLLIHGFGQNRYAWHLPSRSFANYLAKVGFDVFNLDLRGHGRSRELGAKGCTDVEEYVREDLPAAVDEVRRQSNAHSVFLIGHSLGGLVSYASAPSLNGSVRGVASIGSPYHFARGSTPLAFLARLAQTIGFLRRPVGKIPVPVRAIGRAMSLVREFAESPLFPLPLRGWQRGACEPNVLHEHLRLAFDRAGMCEALNLADWAVSQKFGGAQNGYDKRFEELNVPLLVVAGTRDDLAPPLGVRPAYERSHSSDKHYAEFPLGHIDLLVGKDAPMMTWPLLRHWLLAHS